MANVDFGHYTLFMLSSLSVRETVFCFAHLKFKNCSMQIMHLSTVQRRKDLTCLDIEYKID